MDPLLKLKEPKFKKRKRRDPNANEIAGMGAVLGTTAGMATFLKMKENEQGKKDSATEKKVMPKEKPKDFYEGEGYKGAPDMYPDYEEDKKERKKSKMNYGGSTNKYKSGSYVQVKTKLAKTKPCKLC